MDATEALRQIKDILENIDLPPQEVMGQARYDEIMEIIERGCPTDEVCAKCALDIADSTDYGMDRIREILSKMRGHKEESE